MRILLLLLAGCTTAAPTQPQPTPEPVVEKPDPFYIPNFLAPDVVAVGTPFTITLCGEPWSPGLQVKANGHLLGTMAHHRETGARTNVRERSARRREGREYGRGKTETT